MRRGMRAALAVLTAALAGGVFFGHVFAAAGPGEVVAGNTFQFEIDGQQIAARTVTPGAVTFQLDDVPLRARTGNFKSFTVAKPIYSNWIVTRVWDKNDLSLSQLFADFASGKRAINPADAGSLVYLDGRGAEARRINFFGYAPIAYQSIGLDTRTPTVAVETLEFAVSRLEFSAAGVGNLLPDAAAAFDAAPRDAPAVPGGFRLDLIAGGSDPSSNWYSITGGGQRAALVDDGRGGQTLAGQTEFDEVVVVGPLLSSSRGELVQWLNGWTAGKGAPTNATLELLDANQQVIRAVTFFDSLPTAYTPPAVNADDPTQLEESFSFKPERVEG